MKKTAGRRNWLAARRTSVHDPMGMTHSFFSGKLRKKLFFLPGFFLFFAHEVHLPIQRVSIRGKPCTFFLVDHDGVIEMDLDALMFFEKWPDILPLYAKLLEEIHRCWPETICKVQKTQISFYHRHGFACVWPPIRKFKGFPVHYLGLTLGLPYPLSSSRVAAVTEPYPGRWTHHIPLSDQTQIDGELLSWIEEAYVFAENKR